jgi:hypothetical protein
MTLIDDTTSSADFYGAPGCVVKWLARPLQAIRAEPNDDEHNWRTEARDAAYRRYINRFFKES